MTMGTRGRQYGSRARAFTLVEVICTISILAVVGVLSSRLVFTASDQYLAAASRSAIGAELSSAMERIATEVRQIPAKTGVTPTEANLGAISAGSLAWTDASAVSRVLALSGTNLTMTEGANTFVLLSGVTAFGVQAYDQSNTALAASLASGATAAVRRLEISITVARNGQSETLRSRFFLRCTVEGGAP
jgi:prepilin-type N-terminal cleavage/methylation domain-containing protein